MPRPPTALESFNDIANDAINAGRRLAEQMGIPYPSDVKTNEATDLSELLDIANLVASIPIDGFTHLRNKPDDMPVMAWDGVEITIGDVKHARDLLAKYGEE